MTSFEKSNSCRNWKSKLEKKTVREGGERKGEREIGCRMVIERAGKREGKDITDAERKIESEEEKERKDVKKRQR